MPNLIRLQRALEIMKSLKDSQVNMAEVMRATACGSCGCIVGHALTDRETFPDIEFLMADDRSLRQLPHICRSRDGCAAEWQP